MEIETHPHVHAIDDAFLPHFSFPVFALLFVLLTQRLADPFLERLAALQQGRLVLLDESAQDHDELWVWLLAPTDEEDVDGVRQPLGRRRRRDILLDLGGKAVLFHLLLASLLRLERSGVDGSSGELVDVNLVAVRIAAGFLRVAELALDLPFGAILGVGLVSEREERTMTSTSKVPRKRSACPRR